MPEGQTPQAFTAVINSATLSKPDKRIFLYQAVPVLQTLGVEQRDIDETNPADVYSWEDAETSVAPKLRNPSTLVSLTFSDRLHIYGVLNGTNTIAMVSPVYAPVDKFPVAEQGHIAGTSDGKQAWLFWQTVDKTTKPPTNKILYKAIAGKSVKPKETAASSVLDKTSLAGAHDGKNNWLVYQRKKDDLHPLRLLCLGPILSGEVDIHKDGTRFRPNTPIAALFVPRIHFKDDEKFGFGPKDTGRLYVYYLNSVNVVYGTHANLSSDNGSPKFSKLYEAGSDQNFRGDGTSQLTAIYDAEHRRNVIYTILADQENTGISPIWDAWEDNSSPVGDS